MNISGLNSNSTLYQLYQNTSLSSTGSKKSSLSAQSTGSFLSGLLEDGTLTEEQQKKVQNALAQAMQPPPPPKPAEQGSFVSDTISSLVEGETLTQEEGDTVQSALEEALSADLSPEDAREAVESKLAELVEAGAITQDQRTSISSALDEAAQAAKPMGPPPPKGEGLPQDIASSLSTLAEEGTISEEDEDAIIEYLLESQENGTKPDLGDLVEQGLLSEEKKDTVEETFREAAQYAQAKHAYTGSLRNEDPLQSLVEDGTISSSAKNLIYQTMAAYGTYSTLEKFS